MSWIPRITFLGLAASSRLSATPARSRGLGPIRSIRFVRVSNDGMDVYQVTCRHKRSTWEIAPLTADGRISAIFFKES